MIEDHEIPFFVFFVTFVIFVFFVVHVPAVRIRNGALRTMPAINDEKR